MNIRNIFFTVLSAVGFFQAHAQYQMEYLARGVYAVNSGNGKVFVSWRLLGTENNDLSFNLYRTAKGKTKKLNQSPLQTATGFTDESVDTSTVNVYTVKAIINKKEEFVNSFANTGRILCQ